MENINPQQIKESVLSIKSFKWTLFGIVISIISGIFAIYTFLYTPKPELSFIVTSKTNVLDINAPLSNMDILLDSISLKDRNENIKVFNLKIINNGNANITTDLYDSYMPISIRVTGGNILKKPEVIMASNDYIKRNLESRFEFKNDSIIVIPNIIMDITDYADVKLLILHKNDIMPEIGVTGKVSGQNKLFVTEAEIKSTKSFWNDYFPLSIGVFFAQLFSYFIISIFIILIIVFISDKVKKRQTIIQRKKAVKEFELKHKIKEVDRFIINKYLDEGFEFIDTVKDLFYDTSMHSYYIENIGKENEGLIAPKATTFKFLAENEVITDEKIKSSIKKLITAFHTFLVDKKLTKY